MRLITICAERRDMYEELVAFNMLFINPVCRRAFRVLGNALGKEAVRDCQRLASERSDKINDGLLLQSCSTDKSRCYA